MTTDTDSDDAAVFDADDFGISVKRDGDSVVVDHFYVAPPLRGNDLGSAILETIKRVYYYEGADRLTVRMGGGEAAESFLKRNGFTVTERRPYSETATELMDAEYGVTAVWEYSH